MPVTLAIEYDQITITLPVPQVLTQSQPSEAHMITNVMTQNPSVKLGKATLACSPITQTSKYAS